MTLREFVRLPGMKVEPGMLVRYDYPEFRYVEYRLQLGSGDTEDRSQGSDSGGGYPNCVSDIITVGDPVNLTPVHCVNDGDIEGLVHGTKN